MNHIAFSKVLDLAADLLSDASDRFSSSRCNDWDWPDSLKEPERHWLVRKYHELNGDPEEYDPEDEPFLMDWEVLWLCGQLLRERAEIRRRI